MKLPVGAGVGPSSLLPVRQPVPLTGRCQEFREAQSLLTGGCQGQGAKFCAFDINQGDFP